MRFRAAAGPGCQLVFLWLSRNAQWRSSGIVSNYAENTAFVQVLDETDEKCPRNTLHASRRNARATVSIVRPYKKNYQGTIESKNNDLVRKYGFY